MKTILVTGSNGLLGQKITEKIVNEGGYNLIATAKGENRFIEKKGYRYEDMDVLNPIQVASVVAKYQPDAIIHTAAMTNVDTCHKDREGAYALNVTAVETLIEVCEKHNIQLIHLSTDFVFDGKNGPYKEEDQPNPVSYYGETKLMAEELIKKSNCKWAVLRTILVYGILKDMSRSNIILWAKGELDQGKTINVVEDQWRMPTLAEDLADACLLAVAKEAEGIYHVSGKDMMTILQLVEQVATYWHLDSTLIQPISSASLNQAAHRPIKTGFDLTKTINQLGYQPRSFTEGLQLVEQQLQDLGYFSIKN